MFVKILIANRGAIACRIERTLRRLNIASVAVYSDADVASLHVSQADEAVHLPGARAGDTYLNMPLLLEVARNTGAQAIHPGYGFLAENADFAAACAAQGVVFLGPRPESMRSFALKHEARRIAQEQGLQMLPGSGLLRDAAHAQAAAAAVGFPVMLKSSAGGGGIGMSVCQDPAQLDEAFASVERMAKSSFGDARIYLERYVANARHIEVQVFGDGVGEVVILGDRDCSVQRRNQKVVEEAPAPNLPLSVRLRIADWSARLMSAVRYRSAGTVEFLYDALTEQVYFLEVNTRLQVEHGVTELVTGIDIVEWMVRLGAQQMQPLNTLSITPRGHAMQARIYAEDPDAGFRPATGLLTQVQFPEDARVDTWIAPGVEVSGHYDPLLAKVLVHGNDRNEARLRLGSALDRTRIAGVQTNRSLLLHAIGDTKFIAAKHDTKLLADLVLVEPGCEVLVAGTQTTVQDYPGRTGYWDVGVPPSGPMDDYAFRLGNRLLGNVPDAPGLEMTASGATLRFRAATRVALTGAAMSATLDGEPVPLWQVIEVGKGQTLALGAVMGRGIRTYLCVAGGFDVPAYLGSCATFTLGGFGGHGGRALRVGDVLPFAHSPKRLRSTSATALNTAPNDVPLKLRPTLSDVWILRVLNGPHSTSELFAADYLSAFFAAEWQVHFQSSRTGVRLLGPKPTWARKDGGDAGLHPSNIHDNAYAIGAVDFTGDMPVILGPDGPSLGGFVCPVTVVVADQWMLGQMRAGDRVRFAPITEAQALQLVQTRDRQIETLVQSAAHDLPDHTQPASSHRTIFQQRLPSSESAASDAAALEPAVLQRFGKGATEMVIRASGERNILVEFGESALDLRLRLRAEALRRWLVAHPRAGLLELTPGSRSLQIHYEPRQLKRAALLDLVATAFADIGNDGNLIVPSRIVHLPLSWDDPATRIAIERYSQHVRADAPWCPNNIDFIRRINGLPTQADVQNIVFAASYLVLGLGDVYLGAPVATPIDPRHRLVTTKYNPARTWTPENAVGIGGAYMCIYGMEGPGGYQFVGRTLQMWNRFPARSGGMNPAAASAHTFTPDKPWLLRCFDQIRFFPVSAAELLDIRRDFPLGRYALRTEDSTFSLPQYEAFLEREAAGIHAFRSTQQAAFAAERNRWAEAGVEYEAVNVTRDETPELLIPTGLTPITSPVAGAVAALVAHEGALLAANDQIVILESMKMEVPIVAPAAARVVKLMVEIGAAVSPGQTVALLEPH